MCKLIGQHIHSIHTRYEQEYSVLRSGTRTNREGEDGGQQLDNLNLPTTFAIPTPNGDIKGCSSLIYHGKDLLSAVIYRNVSIYLSFKWIYF